MKNMGFITSETIIRVSESDLLKVSLEPFRWKRYNALLVKSASGDSEF
jgi:hypothetical protein